MRMVKPQIVRPLGKIEHYSASRHYMGVYRGVSNTCQYQFTQPLSASAWKDWIFAALADVVRAQPFLRVGLVGEHTTHACFVYLPSIDLEAQVDICSLPYEDEYEYVSMVLSLLAKRHDSLWPSTDKVPPWKVVIILCEERGEDFACADVMFSYHHSIGDGTSGKIFHENLLKALRHHGPPSGPFVDRSHSSVLKFPESPILPPPQESLVSFTVNWSFFFGQLWQFFRPSFLAPTEEKPWTGSLVRLDMPYNTKLRLFQMDTVTRDRLLAACRMHSTSLTGLVHAMVLLSFVRQFPSEKTFVGGTPISLRPYVNDPEFDAKSKMHDLVTALKHPFASSTVQELRDLLETNRRELRLEDKVWQVAEEIKQDLNRKQKTLPADDIAGTLHWIPDWQKFVRERDGKPRDWTWELSNVGAFRDDVAGAGDDDDGSLTIRRQVFSQSASRTGAAITLSMAGCDGDKAATIAATWMEDVVSTDVVEALFKDLDAWTRNLASCGRLRGRT